MAGITPSRRQLLKGLSAAAPLAPLFTDASLAGAAASALEDVTIRTSAGEPVQAALALPKQRPAPAVMLIHEWWGLNDQIKAAAAEYAQEGYAALAVDLYNGKVAASREEAERLREAVDPAEATLALVSWIDWLRRHPQVTGKVGTVGWCFGGGWSLNASIATPVDATVIYYGRVDQPASRLLHLKGPVLGHFATRDTWINQEMVSRFEQAMQEAGRSLTVYWYEAEHAFANPTGGRYDAEDAQLAWQRTLDFFRRSLNA